MLQQKANETSFCYLWLKQQFEGHCQSLPSLTLGDLNHLRGATTRRTGDQLKLE